MIAKSKAQFKTVASAPPPFNPATSPDPVPSPCVGVCRIDAASGLCEGCWRTLDEIAAWASLGDGARRAVWQRLPARQWPQSS